MALILSGSIDARGSAAKPQYVGTASFAATASFALNAGGATFDTGSLLTTASVETNVVTFTKGDASTFDITVQTGSIPAGTVSSSAQTIANLPAGTVSSSAQTVANLPSGTISGSEQLPSDIVSSSAQTIANLSGTDIISGSSQLPSGLVSSSVQVSDITASSIVNAETSSIAQANEIVFTKGDGTTFSITQDTSSFVKSVNALAPDASGNVSTTLTATKTGTSASMLAYSSSGLFNDAEIWIVSGQSGSDPLAGSGSNGKSFIFVSSSGELSQLASVDQPIYDARYVFKFGDTMTGPLILNADPSDVLGATPKQYVDVAYTGSLITSASDGTNTLTLRTRGGGTETHTFNSASFAITASHAQFSLSSTDSEDLIVGVKNDFGATIQKGTPVYAKGVLGENILVAPASASDSTKMPAIAVLNETLAINEAGNALISGRIRNVNTLGFTAGRTVYVGANGGYTQVKPTGSALIQNLGIVGKVNATEGEGVVVGAGRANDVPNIVSGSSWVGNSDGVPVAVPTASFLVDTASFSTTASYAETASYALNAAGGGGNVETPVITGTLTATIEQFTSFAASDYAIQGGASGMWAVINNGDMTASLGTTTTISNTNSITTNILNNTGSFTSDIYALTALGRSNATTLTITVDQFNLSSSNVFGSLLENYYVQTETGTSTNPPPGTTAQYVYWGNGVINDDQNVLDVENTTGITGIDTRDYAIWYNASAGKLLAAQYTQAGTLDSIQACEVDDFTNTSTNQTSSGYSNVTTDEKLQGKLFGKYQTVSGFYHVGAPSSNFYLEISGSDGLFNSFGTNGQGDWMYGFNLLDDWVQSPGGPNMLMPTGSGKPFIFAPTSYYITTSDSDYIIYGDDTTVPSTTTGINWAADSNGVMAPSGSSIIVWFDDSANTTYLYVDGVEKVNSTNIDNYMGTSATTDPVLQFGNIEPFIPNINYGDQEWLQNFPWRINNLWVANAGTSLSSADVTELASHANISDSTNYASIEFHSQEINETPDKGTAVLSRQSFTRPVTPP